MQLEEDEDSRSEGRRTSPRFEAPNGSVAGPRRSLTGGVAMQLNLTEAGDLGEVWDYIHSRYYHCVTIMDLYYLMWLVSAPLRDRGTQERQVD